MKNPLSSQIWRCAISLAAGLLLVFSYAPYSQAWSAPVLLSVWLFMLIRSQSARQAFTVSFAFGLGWFAAGISWVHVSIEQYGGMPLVFSLLLMLILAAYLALFPALAGWGWYRLRHKTRFFSLWLLPLLWMVSEWLRGWLLTGFPWLGLGYAQNSSQLGALAPHLGEAGIAVTVLFIAISLTALVLRKNPMWLFVPVLCYGLSVLAPRINPMEPTGESFTAALVQGNIVQDLKWNAAQQWPNLNTYLKLSERFDDHDIVVWPETAVTFIEPYAGPLLRELDHEARQSETALITGIIDADQQGDYYNSIIVLGKQAGMGYQHGNQNRYQKHQLLPIGEFVPFGDLLRPLAPLFNLPMSDFSRGPLQQQNLIANDLHLSASICYEVAFSDQMRANFTPETQVLVTVSNDTWFGRSHGPHQHHEIAIMRARELGRPLLRATNNGITAAVDETGNTISRIPQFEAGVASARVSLVEGATIYSRWGNLGAWLLALIPALLVMRWRNLRSA